MPTYPYRKPGAPGEPIHVVIDGHVARRIRELHRTVNIGRDQFWNRTDDGYMWEA